MNAQWKPLTLLIVSLTLPAAAFAQLEQEPGGDYYDAAEASPVAAEFASFLQPRFQTPADAVAPEGRQRSARSSQRNSYVQLARAPNMFGDLIFIGGQLVFDKRDNGRLTADLPLGGGRSFKIGENNKPIPMDRVYFNYNGYVNAVTFAQATFGPPVPNDTNLNQYTFGFEKTFLDGCWSIDVRMPITDGFQASSPGFGIDSGRYGNLAAYLKHMIYQDDSLAIAYGCGLGLPTGSNLDAFVDGARITVQNDAVHLLPYIGFFDEMSEDWFLQGFFGLDFATTGNDVVIGSPGRSVGRLNEQNLAHADLSLGRWLYRNPAAKYGQGLAGIFELHYSTTIQDSDTINFASSTQAGFISGSLNNPANRIDLLNLTAGLHWQITELSNFRVGCAVPLRAEPDRAFDAEIQASFNRHF